MRTKFLFCVSSLTLTLWILACEPARGNEPKQTKENTISVALAAPVVPQKFAGAPKFAIASVTDRSGNPQPLLVYRPRGGVFLDRQPTEIAREAFEGSLKAAGLLAPDAASANLVLQIYIFHFGLANGSGLDFFGKVEFAATVKNPKTGESRQVQASGTSIANGAIRKKNIQRNVEANIEAALEDALRNFLRGTQLRDAVVALAKPPENAPATVPAAAPPAADEPSGPKS